MALKSPLPPGMVRSLPAAAFLAAWGAGYFLCPPYMAATIQSDITMPR